MSKSVAFLHEAQVELTEAALFYDAQVRGLGATFVDAVERAISEIQSHPKRWPEIGKRVRKRFIGRFPHAVLYRETADEIIVVAIMHLHRRPGYWRDRV